MISLPPLLVEHVGTCGTCRNWTQGLPLCPTHTATELRGPNYVINTLYNPPSMTRYDRKFLLTYQLIRSGICRPTQYSNNWVTSLLKENLTNLIIK